MRLGERCCLCGGPMRPRFSRHGTPIAECGNCGHRCAVTDIPDDHVQRVYGPEYFEGGKAGYAGYLAQAAILRERGRFYGGVLRNHVPAGSRVLDVGSAGGLVADGLRSCGFEVEGVEPNPEMAAHARDCLGLVVHVGAFEDIALEGLYDAVVMLQVLSHFVRPDLAVQRASRALRSGGVLLVETWDRSSRTARLFGRLWHEYSPPSVLHWFTRHEVHLLCSRHGLVHCGGGRPPRRIALDHAISLLGHTIGLAGLGRAGARLVSRLGIRWAVRYPGDDLFYEMFTRSGNAPSGEVR